MALVDRALALNPSFARGWNISGLLRLFGGQPERAIEHAEAALRLSPRDCVGTTVGIIGTAHLVRRRFDEALPKLLLAIQEAPTFPVPYRWLASCYAHMGRLDEARDVVKRLRDITPVVVPPATQFRDPEHRNLLLSGLRLAAGGWRSDMINSHRAAMSQIPVSLPSRLIRFRVLHHARNPSAPCLSAHWRRLSRSPRNSNRGTANPHEVSTRSTFRSRICLDPGMGGKWETRSSQTASRGCTTMASPYARTIIGCASNEHHINVMRGVSRRCAAASFSDPVKLSHTMRFGETTRKESIPLGETLTLPSLAAVPTKNIFCWFMKFSK
jgi:hypothetical protein